MHSALEKRSRSSPTFLQVASTSWGSAARMRCLSLAKTCSIGLRSGLYGGKKMRWAASGADSLASRFALVAAKVVENDDLARCEGGCQHLLDVQGEELTIDGTINHRRRADPIVTQRLGLVPLAQAPRGGVEGFAGGALAGGALARGSASSAGSKNLARSPHSRKRVRIGSRATCACHCRRRRRGAGDDPIRLRPIGDAEIIPILKTAPGIRVIVVDDCTRERLALVVSFQEVVHPVRNEEAEVVEALANPRRTE